MNHKDILAVAAFALALAVCCLLINNLGTAQTGAETELVYTAVRDAALTCYAIEGAYPPDLQYLRDNYGIRYDRSRYVVSYDAFASNLMPEIRVMIRGQQ